MQILKMKKTRSIFAALTAFLFVMANILGIYSQIYAGPSDKAKITGFSVSTSHDGEVKTPSIPPAAKKTDIQKIRLSVSYDKEIKLMDKDGDGSVTNDILKEFEIKLYSGVLTTLTDTEAKSGAFEMNTYGKYAGISLSEDNKTLYIDVYVGYSSYVGTVTVASTATNTTILTADSEQPVEWEDISVQPPIGGQLATVSQTVADGSEVNASVTKQLSFTNAAIRGNTYFVLLKNGQPVGNLKSTPLEYHFSLSNDSYLDTDAAKQMMKNPGTMTNFNNAFNSEGYTLTLDETDSTTFTISASNSAKGDVLDLLIVEYPRQDNTDIDNEALSDKISEAKALNKSSYTEESYTSLASVLAKADSVNKNVMTTSPVYYLQSEVDAQTAALTAAIAALIPSEGGGEDPGENPGEEPDTEPAVMTGYEVDTFNQGEASVPVQDDFPLIQSNDQVVRIKINFDKEIYLVDVDRDGDMQDDILDEFKVYLYGYSEDTSRVTSLHKNYYGVDRYAEVSKGSDNKSLIFDIHIGYSSRDQLVIDVPDILTTVKTVSNDIAAECEGIDIYHTNGVSMDTVSQTIADPDKGIEASVTVNVNAPTGKLIRSAAYFVLLENGNYGPKGGFQGLESVKWIYGSPLDGFMTSFSTPTQAEIGTWNYNYLSMDSESYAQKIADQLKAYIDNFNESYADSNSGSGDNKYFADYEIIRTGTQITITRHNAKKGDIIDFLLAGNQRDLARGSGSSMSDNAKDKSALQTLISQASKLKEVSYTKSSFAVLSKELAFAKNINSSKFFVQSEVDAQAAKLSAAIEQLVPSGETAPDDPQVTENSAKITGISSVYSQHSGEVSYSTYNGTTDTFDDQVFNVTVNFDKEITLVDKDGDGSASDDVVDELNIILNSTMDITSVPTGLLSYEYTTTYTGAEPYKKYATVTLGEDKKSLKFKIHVGYAPFSGNVKIQPPEDGALSTVLTADSSDSVDWSNIEFFMATGGKLETVKQVVATDAANASVTKKVSGFPAATRGMVHLIFLKNGVPVASLNSYGGNVTAHNHNYLSMTNETFSMLIAGSGGADVDDGGFGAGSSGYFGNTFGSDYISVANGDTFTITAKDSEPGDVIDLLIVGYPRDTRAGYTDDNSQDKSELEAAIQEAQAIDSSLYTPKTYAALQAEITKANIVNESEYYLRDEVDAQTASLESAVTALRTVEEGDLPDEEPNEDNGSPDGKTETHLTDTATGIQLIADSGVLPAETQLIINQLTSGAVYDSVKLQISDISGKFTIFDISLEKDGVTIQPDGTVTVKIPIPEGYDASKIKLYHIKGDTRAEVAFTISGNYIIFTADSFSPYVIVEAANTQAVTTSASTVQTGDSESMTMYIMLMGAVAIYGTIEITRRARRKSSVK